MKQITSKGSNSNIPQKTDLNCLKKDKKVRDETLYDIYDKNIKQKGKTPSYVFPLVSFPISFQN